METCQPEMQDWKVKGIAASWQAVHLQTELEDAVERMQYAGFVAGLREKISLGFCVTAQPI